MTNINNIKSVYMIGIGGIGMSALARYFLSKGVKVSGSDRIRSIIIQDLEKLGVDIYKQREGDDISKGENYDLVVITEAIPESNADLIKARELNLKILKYAEVLGLISKEYETIAICGTHGKTTTTGLTLSMMNHAEIAHIGIVGSLLRSGTNFVEVNNLEFESDLSQLGSLVEMGNQYNKKYFVVEACEYKRSFLNLRPKHLIITNIDADHLDYYKDINEIKKAFIEMCQNVIENGTVYYHSNDENSKSVIESFKNLNTNTIKLIDVDSEYQSQTLDLTLLGEHNQKNARLVYELGKNLNIQESSIRIGLKKFEGTWRRLDYKGLTKNGAIVIDDYAHHPAEIKATYQAIKSKYLDKKLIVVFQPHLHSRTASLFEDFVYSLSFFDQVYILPIYRARNEEAYGVSSELLASKIISRTENAAIAVTFENVYEFIKGYNKDCVILTLGAGDNNIIAEELVAL
jgi:UDP-N-acetylmuramate--alanine ligase